MNKNKRDIIKTIAAVFGVTTLSIMQKCRTQDVVDARMACYLLMRKDLGMTFESIATTIGGRDHAAVIHGVRRAKFMYDTYNFFKEKFDRARLLVLSERVTLQLAELDAIREQIVSGEKVDYQLTINKPKTTNV